MSKKVAIIGDLKPEMNAKKGVIIIVGNLSHTEKEFFCENQKNLSQKVVFLTENIYHKVILEKMASEIARKNDIVLVKEYMQKPENLEAVSEKAEELFDSLNSFKHIEQTQLEIAEFTEKEKREPNLTEIKKVHKEKGYKWDGWFTLADVELATTLGYNDAKNLLQKLFIVGVLVKQVKDKIDYYRLFKDKIEFSEYCKLVKGEKTKEIEELNVLINKFKEDGE